MRIEGWDKMLDDLYVDEPMVAEDIRNLLGVDKGLVVVSGSRGVDTDIILDAIMNEVREGSRNVMICSGEESYEDIICYEEDSGEFVDVLCVENVKSKKVLLSVMSAIREGRLVIIRTYSDEFSKIVPNLVKLLGSQGEDYGRELVDMLEGIIYEGIKKDVRSGEEYKETRVESIDSKARLFISMSVFGRWSK